MKRLTVFLLAVLWIGTFVQAQDEPPYLYYFSNTLNAFVVERADGTDSHILIDHAKSQNANAIGGPGWSPSGEWFVWSNLRTATYTGPDIVSSFAIRTDNTELHSLPEGYAQWWPNTDILVFKTSTSDGETFSIKLWDINSENEIASFDFTAVALYSFSGLQWSSDGEYAGFYYVKNDTEITYFVLIARDGEIMERPFMERPFDELGYLDRPNRIWAAEGWVPHISTDGTRIIVENPSQRDSFSINTPSDNTLNFVWNPSGLYALVYETLPRSSTQLPYQLWLLSIEQRSLTLVDDSVYRGEFFSPFIPDFDGQIENSWSPDGSAVAFQSADRQFSILYPSTGEVAVIPFTYETSSYLMWSPANVLYMVTSTQDNRYIAATYDTFNGQLTKLDSFPTELGFVGFSPTGRYRILYDFWRMASPDVTRLVNQETSSVTELPVHSQREEGRNRTSWDASEYWILTGDQTIGYEYLIGVTNADATLWRELTTCDAFEEPCIGWLPAHVGIANLPS